MCFFIFTFNYDHLHTLIREYFSNVHFTFIPGSLEVSTDEVKKKKKKKSLQLTPLSNFYFSGVSPCFSSTNNSLRIVLSFNTMTQKVLLGV